MPSSLLRDDRDPALPPNHPVNALSPLRKLLILMTLSYSGFLANFSVAIIQCGFGPLGKAFGVPPGDIPHTIGYNLLGLAVGPLLWNPLSKTIGRRPVYLLGSTLFLPCVIWMALSNSYACFSAARVVAGLCSSFSQTVPPATVADIYVKEVRGSKMSMFGTAVVVAPAVAPVFSGLIVNSLSWRILFWLVLALAGLQLVLFFFVVPETLWIPTPTVDEAPSPGTAVKGNSPTPSMLDTAKPIACEEEHLEMASVPGGQAAGAGHVGAAWMPWRRPVEFLRVCFSPVAMVRFIPTTLVSIYYGSIFAWSVGITIVMPQKFEEAPYNFELIPLGCAFLAFGIGGILGKWSGGIVGDKVVRHMHARAGTRQPEQRLWALLPILPFMVVGCAIVGVTLKQELHWIAYLIGGGLFFFCLSAATGILQTYVLECYLPRSMDTQAVFVFFKCIWGFVIPQFVTLWGEERGYLEEYIVQGVLSAGVGALLCVSLILKGRSLREWQGMPVSQ